MSVSSMLVIQGSAVVAINATPIAATRNGRVVPNTRSVSCRIHSVAIAWKARLIQNRECSPKCR